MCGTAICKDFMSVTVKDEMAACICIPSFQIYTADALLRIILPHPCSTILSTWTLILSNGTDISSGEQVKPWFQVLNETETFVYENELSKYFLLSKSALSNL